MLILSDECSCSRLLLTHCLPPPPPLQAAEEGPSGGELLGGGRGGGEVFCLSSRHLSCLNSRHQRERSSLSIGFHPIGPALAESGLEWAMQAIAASVFRYAQAFESSTGATHGCLSVHRRSDYQPRLRRRWDPKPSLCIGVWIPSQG